MPLYLASLCPVKKATLMVTSEDASDCVCIRLPHVLSSWWGPRPWPPPHMAGEDALKEAPVGASPAKQGFEKQLFLLITGLLYLFQTLAAWMGSFLLMTSDGGHALIPIWCVR